MKITKFNKDWTILRNNKKINGSHQLPMINLIKKLNNKLKKMQKKKKKKKVVIKNNKTMYFIFLIANNQD